MLLMAWLSALAGAQALDPDEAPELPEPAVLTTPNTLEITVWGTLAIQKAEGAIVKKVEGLGYESRRSGGRVVFKPERRFHGAAILQDGMLTFRTPVAGFQPLPPETYTQDSRRRTTAVGPDGTNLDPDVGVGPSIWLFPSQRKLDTVRASVRAEIEPELQHYRAVVSRTLLEERLLSLPDELDALWEQGTALVGSESLATPEARRNHALAFWASRADSEGGRRACEVVGAWLESVVQHSDHPITTGERERWEAERTDECRLPQ